MKDGCLPHEKAFTGGCNVTLSRQAQRDGGEPLQPFCWQRTQKGLLSLVQHGCHPWTCCLLVVMPSTRTSDEPFVALTAVLAPPVGQGGGAEALGGLHPGRRRR